MATPPLSIQTLREAVEAYHRCGQNAVHAAHSLGLHPATYQNRLRIAKTKGMMDGAVDKAADALTTAGLRDRVRQLESELKFAQREQLDAEYVKAKIIGLKDADPTPPAWLVRPNKAFSGPGVPTLFCSDLHWGEIVDPNQIGGVNRYSITIAQERLRTMVEVAIDLLTSHLKFPKYPGIVLALGGDMVSGDIHEELVATNEAEIMPVVLDLWACLVWAIEKLADTFGSVFVPCVSGNHGRNTHKIRAKGRNFTSFDWLLYQFLAKRFESDKRVRFMIPDGPDCYYSVMGHRYLLTHGDQFRGGDGMIGALGPIIRGDHKKRSRNAQIGMEYDTMLMGHWHQLIQLRRLIVNGCFPAGSKVLTNTGYNAIDQISIGDVVMSRDGSQQTVTHVFTKEADRLVGIKVAGLPDVVRSTPNHLIWAVKRASATSDVTPSRRHHIAAPHGPAQWVPMDFLSPGDYVHVPFPKGDARPIDEETAWAYGLYLAEGSTLLDGGASKKHNRVCLTMHNRELDVLKRFAAWFSKTFGVEPRVYTRTKRSGGVTSEFVASPGRDACVWFRDTFGHGAADKHLPPGALWWADDLKSALLRGWIDGDGHSAPQTDCRPTISATSISAELAWGMFHITPACGAWPTLAKLSKGGPRKSDSYTVHLNKGQSVIVINGEAFYQIAERYETAGKVPVFDLEVSGEHTYNVGGIGVHNSLKGYDEYANQNNFGFEPPQQALWLTHPEQGITFSAPVHVERSKKTKAPASWVGWQQAA